MSIMRAARKHLPPEMFSGALGVYSKITAFKNGVNVHWTADGVDLSKGRQVIRLSSRHKIYVADAANNFEFYFSAVQPRIVDGREVVDYSQPSDHNVIGYNPHDIRFPSFAEPLITTRQYIEFAELAPGMVVVDIGAYSGLTSIIFKDVVGETGRVVAVEADAQSVDCMKINFARYNAITGLDIELLYGAAWEDDEGIDFSSEGNMGASAVSVLGAGRGERHRVASFTLCTIAERCALNRIDFVKCDVEGAESVIFKDSRFFQKHRPRMLIETHKVNGSMTTAKCLADVAAHGYGCKVVRQTGYDLPLIECIPLP